MRLLLIICAGLVIANVVLVFWPSAGTYAAHVHAPSAEVNPHFIRLNKEIEDKYLSAKAGADTAVRLEVAADGSSQCFRLGPFMHKSNYELAQAVLFNANVDYQKSVRQARQTSVYRVYLGPYVTQAEALDMRTELKSRDILDNFVRKQEDGTFVVSLGIFTTTESAEDAVALFDGKLDAVKLKQEDLVLPDNYFLHFTLHEGSSAHEQLRLIDWGEQSVKLGRYQCRTEQNSG